MAAISRMMSVTSCSASHTSCRKVFGFFGGMKFCPKICFLFSKSGAVPGKPVDRGQANWSGARRDACLSLGAEDGAGKHSRNLPGICPRTPVFQVTHVLKGALLNEPKNMDASRLKGAFHP